MDRLEKLLRFTPWTAWTQLRACGATLAMGLTGPFLVPFSRAWRHRMSACYQQWEMPFHAQTVALSDLLDDPLDVVIGPVAAQPHNVSELELLALCCLVAQLRCRRVFEIGTFDGRAARGMALNLPLDGRCYTLNLPPGQTDAALGLSNGDASVAAKVTSGQRFLGTPEAERIEQLWGDSATFDYTPYAGQMDLVFIDGSHTETYVANDTHKALELLRPEGGLLVWHDAPLYGVAPFLVKWMRHEKVPLRLIHGTSLAIAARVDTRFVDPVIFTHRRTFATTQ